MARAQRPVGDRRQDHSPIGIAVHRYLRSHPGRERKPEVDRTCSALSRGRAARCCSSSSSARSSRIIGITATAQAVMVSLHFSTSDPEHASSAATPRRSAPSSTTTSSSRYLDPAVGPTDRERTALEAQLAALTRPARSCASSSGGRTGRSSPRASRARPATADGDAGVPRAPRRRPAQAAIVPVGRGRRRARRTRVADDPPRVPADQHRRRGPGGHRDLARCRAGPGAARPRPARRRRRHADRRRSSPRSCCT